MIDLNAISKNKIIKENGSNENGYYVKTANELTSFNYK